METIGFGGMTGGAYSDLDGSEQAPPVIPPTHGSKGCALGGGLGGNAPEWGLGQSPNPYGTVRLYTRAAVPLYSAFFSAAEAPAVMSLKAFHSSV